MSGYKGKNKKTSENAMTPTECKQFNTIIRR